MKDKNENKKELELIKEFIEGDINENERVNFVEKTEIKESENQENEIFEFDVNEAWTKLHKRFENNGLIIEDKKAPVIRMYQKLMKFAAVILLFLSLSFVGYYVYNTKNLVSYRTVHNYQTKEIKLSDGSKVSLNENSSIKFPEEFDDNIRKIEFTGEGFFEIAKMSNKPFIIVAGGTEVKVLGTSFNVNISNDKNVEVTVRTGKVQLSEKKNPKKNVLIKPGYTGTYTKGEFLKNKTENINYLSWKTHKFYYNCTKLSKVISDFNKVYKTNIIFANNKIGETELTTTFENKSIETILTIICTSHGLRYEKTENDIILSFKKP